MVPDAAAPVEVSVVMPCLNEARTIAGCVREAVTAMAAAGLRGEVVVADNGSNDGSQQLAVTAGARVVPVAAPGYGNALRGGFAAAAGRWIIMGDADGSYDFSHLPRFVERLRAGADLVLGNRFRGGIEPGAMPWKNRRIGNPVLSFLGRLFFRTGIGDFHCGLRGFSSAAYRRMELRTTGMEFASEMVIKSVVLGLRVEEVPTVLRRDGRDRPPHLRPWRDGWRHLRFMLLFSPQWLFLYPGLLLIGAGLGLGACLLRGPVSVGRVQFDVHTLLFASLAVLVGFQAVTFAVLSKFFAARAGLRGPQARLESWLQHVTLEKGVFFGLLLVLTGLLLWADAVWVWGETGFGRLQPTQTLRWVIPGALCLAVGCQLTLTSFFLGVLRLDTREDAA
ncbi:MAG TPA: glycosyltransferase family 2 protein [Candidatus Didemnitutus sp.]|nr:glycosyltransferase family 2 protein [Candidatus Didemnitutus sp.]